MVLVACGNESRPGLDGSSLRIGVATVVSLQFVCILFFEVFGRRDVAFRVKIRRDPAKLLVRYRCVLAFSIHQQQSRKTNEVGTQSRRTAGWGLGHYGRLG